MTYELAKQLKDAGFPQVDSKFYWVTVGKEQPELLPAQCHYGGAIYLAAPTLSELIEACGDRFSSLHLFSDKVVFNGKQGKWGATDIKIFTIELTHQGSTPEEAVANLWLSINPK